MSKRWPGWVYAEGTEPDYRFSFANERTFLAWLRTALALLAAGVAVDVVPLDLDEPVRRGLAALLVGLGLLAAVAAWLRWAAAERAMRRRQPLPSFGFAGVLTLCLVLAGVIVLMVA
ncbi:DUF202 domain-containing protein [Nocardioides limicola]|uniref:DUF202 domain-containing protein n=1 Tax=Nocardioides limicola TaxID=2803368 RepID=UPI00193B9BEE|nr:DUF202 domain-containing protein [Nocardioides sp. DJM-14]